MCGYENYDTPNFLSYHSIRRLDYKSCQSANWSLASLSPHDEGMGRGGTLPTLHSHLVSTKGTLFLGPLPARPSRGAGIWIADALLSCPEGAYDIALLPRPYSCAVL